MKAKEWLKEFCKQKSEMLGGEVKYVNQDDLDEIDTWDKEECFVIALKIKDNIERDALCDTAYCPWCLKFYHLGIEKCFLCGYGERHGVCDFEGSDYQKITYSGDAIFKQINLKDLPIMKEEIE